MLLLLQAAAPAATGDLLPMPVCVDPLIKVLRSDTNWPSADAVAEAPRGGHATFQFVIRATPGLSRLRATALFDDATLTRGTSTRFVGYAHVKASYPDAPASLIKSPDGWFPDPLLEDATLDVPPQTAQAIWITVAVPTNQPAGTYPGRLALEASVDGRRQRSETQFSLIVSPVTLTGPKLHVVNWWSDSPGVLTRLAGRPVIPYSDDYWKAIEQIARVQADSGQDTIYLSPLKLAVITRTNGVFNFDYSRFDRMVEIFRQAGVDGPITGSHLAGRAQGADWGAAPFVLHPPAIAGARGDDLSDTNLSAFYSAWLPALRAHLQGKGWIGSYLQHIADEPTAANAPSYRAVCDLVRKCGPGLRFIDAVHSPDSLTREHAVAVPQLDVWHRNREAFDRFATAGGEVWFYTCMHPRGNYANRFIEQPLILTRLLHWINARYGAAGYLHWGFNHWRSEPSPFDETRFLNTPGGGVLPGGDCWIVYPKDKRLLGSIRLEAMRDGLEDWRLLQMLRLKDSARVERLLYETILDFNRYDTDAGRFRARRHELLQALQEK